MGIPTLISTCTADGDALCAFTSGIDSTYDEYMFVITDLNPASGGSNFLWQASTDGGSSYGVTATTSAFDADHREDDSVATLAYDAGQDQAQSTANINLAWGFGIESDESGAGIVHLFNPASTTYVKHFYARFSAYRGDNSAHQPFVAGYFNTTTAINAVKFVVDSDGDFDGVIQMYGIA
jgi:hypothetical protein